MKLGALFANDESDHDAAISLTLVLTLAFIVFEGAAVFAGRTFDMGAYGVASGALIGTLTVGKGLRNAMSRSQQGQQ